MASANQPQPPEFDQEPEGTIIDAPDVSSLALINASEIEQQIGTAKKYPRQMKQFLNDAIELATLDEETAAECIYSLPRDGKAITGPSARLAEILLYAWKNVRGGARIISEEGEFVTAQGMFYDLQNNVGLAYEVKRRIVDKRGNRFKPDMIGVTANAACSIALRNAVLKGIPKALWRKVEIAARKTIVGDIKTLSAKRANALQQFQAFGVTGEMIYRVLGIKGSEDIGIDQLVTLAGMLTALKEGDSTVEEMFAPPVTQDQHLADKNANGINAIKEKYQQPSAPPNPPQPPAESRSAEPAALFSQDDQAKAEQYFDPEEAAKKITGHQRSQRRSTRAESASPTNTSEGGDKEPF